jgi:hypothetical protein
VGTENARGDEKYKKKTFEGNSERKRQFGRPGCKWEDNMKMNHKKYGGSMWTEFTC